jgi:phosphatidylglycerol:prolipoprotein diacylglycerol transferase
VSAMLASFSYSPIVHVVLGPLRISPHGVGIAVGFLLGARLMMPAANRKGITEDDVYSLLTRAAIGAVIGARLAYVINHAGDYTNVIDAFKIWQGGISLLGGFAGAIIAAYPRMRQLRLSFWKVMDAAAPGMALGVIIGRVGDLIVGDHLGKTTSFFLGYRCPPLSVDTASPCTGGAPGPNIPGLVVHHTALYDLILTAILLFVLLRLRRTPRYDGFLILVFGVAYGAQRILEDFLREDVRHFGMTGSQWSALVVGLLCLGWLLFGRRTPRWGVYDRAADSTAEGTGEESEQTPETPTMADASDPKIEE